jgi:hypothetical protein
MSDLHDLPSKPRASTHRPDGSVPGGVATLKDKQSQNSNEMFGHHNVKGDSRFSHRSPQARVN